MAKMHSAWENLDGDGDPSAGEASQEAQLTFVQRGRRWLARKIRGNPHPKRDAVTDPETIEFMHLPKTAGTQVRYVAEALYKKKVGPPIHPNAHRFLLSDLPAEHSYFFALREPISRFSSCFYHRKRKGLPLWFTEWTAAEERAFTQFEHANDLAEALYEDGERGRQAFEAMLSIKHVNLEQANWFTHEGAFLEQRPPIHILRQAKFDTDLELFLTAIGVDERPELVEGDRANKHDYSSTPKLSAKAKENLSRWYARDITLYAMCDAWADANAEAIRSGAALPGFEIPKALRESKGA